MTQPLNFTPKAIEALLSYPSPGAPGTAAGMRYIADKLREAQVFVLPDHGQLIDRSKPRPEVASEIYRPPFPVVALEYTAVGLDQDAGEYTAAKCSKRIALAWEWTDDLPPGLREYRPQSLSAGVVIASVAFYDDHGAWLPIAAAMHLGYDAFWQTPTERMPYVEAMIAAGRIPKKATQSPDLALTPIALLPEVLAGMAAERGGLAGMFDALTADVMDEVNAYSDLCMALACKNVSTDHRPPPKALNRARMKKGKLPLTGFHVLKLNGDELGGSGGGIADRNGPRSHLRRGHIRRLGPDRITWVNSTIVRGRGFVDKVYAI